MRIGIISDTHGNSKYLSEVVQFLKENCDVDKIYHLGDHYKDKKFLEQLGIEYIIVPGLYDPEYVIENIPNIIVDKIEGFHVVLTHSVDEIDLNKKIYKKCKIICHGHTHNWQVELIDGVLYINPGHLKEETHKGRIASFAFLSIDSFFIRVRVFDIKKNLLKEEKFLCF